MGNDNPLVSAIIPTYNRWPLVCESIDSALAQDYPNMEVIVVDDGSSDATEEKLPRHYGDRVTYTRQEYQGPSVARNTGIEHAEGEYIAFLDSDDVWHPEKITRQIEAIHGRDEYAFVYNICHVLTVDGTRTSGVQYSSDRGVTGDNFEAELRHGPMITSAMMVRKEAVEEVGFFDPAILSMQDIDLWFRLAARYPGIFIDAPLTWMREHPGRWTHHVRRTGIVGHGGIQTYEKLLANLPPEREHFRPLVRAHLQKARFEAIPGAEPDDWDEFSGYVHEAIIKDRKAMLNDFAHRGLAASMVVSEAVREDQARDVERLLREELPQDHTRSRGLFRCALARMLILEGRYFSAMRNAARAALISPSVFATNFVAVVFRALFRGVYKGPRWSGMLSEDEAEGLTEG